MENECFYSAGIPPSLLFQPSLSPLQTPNGSHKPHFQKSTENYSHFQSAISSMVSSPATSNSPPIINHFFQENLPNLGNPMPMNSHLPILSTDPGFAERAAKFSCFGSRSFNGRTSQIGLNNGEFRNRSSGLVVRNGKLPRVSSTPSLNIAGSPMGVQEIKNSVQIQMEISAADGKLSNLSGSAANSNEDSSFSGQNPSGENGLRNQNELNSRKRKAVSRVKVKDAANSNSANATKADENSNVKKAKMTEEDQKPPEPPKDYIHVRARRGQATDSHSLAERVRREKIGERMKLLQDLVPGCSKVTGKALMLDEIINYVQSLQRQVKCLSMKLATVNPRLDTDMDSLLSKDILQPNGTMPHQIYPVDLLASAYYGHQGQQNPQTRKSVEPLDATLCPNLGVQLDGFGQGLPQFPAFSEDELQSIFQMGSGPNQTSHMK